jgi:hypothetical protein
MDCLPTSPHLCDTLRSADAAVASTSAFITMSTVRWNYYKLTDRIWESYVYTIQCHKATLFCSVEERVHPLWSNAIHGLIKYDTSNCDVMWWHDHPRVWILRRIVRPHTVHGHTQRIYGSLNASCDIIRMAAPLKTRVDKKTSKHAVVSAKRYSMSSCDISYHKLQL